MPQSKRRMKRWLIGVASLVLLLVFSGVLLYQTSVGKRIVSHGTGLIVPVATAPARFVLVPPEGTYAIGVTHLHLIDTARTEPWVSGKQRELMVSVWYPSTSTEGSAFAPYMTQRVAERYAEITLESTGVNPKDVDLAGVRTYGWQDSPVAFELGALPVVLYSPGGSQPRALGTTHVQNLASHGYIVVTMDHTHESPIVEFPDGRIALATISSDNDTLRKMIAVRVEDTRFVIDQLERIAKGENLDSTDCRLPDGLKEALDLTKIGMFGHSAGGFTAAQAMHEDQRIDAGVNLDGSLGYHISAGEWGEVTNEGLSRPFMLFGAGFSGKDRMPHTHQHAPDWKAFWDNSTGWKLELHMAEGEHFSFADHQSFFPQLSQRFGFPLWLRKGMIGTVDPSRSVESQQAYLTAFFNQHLRSEPQALLLRPEPEFPDVDFIVDAEL